MPAQRETPASYRDYVRHLGQRLARARLNRGLSQQATADRAGIAHYTYYKLESGLSQPGTPANPRLRTLVALSRVLHVPLPDLFPRETPHI